MPAEDVVYTYHRRSKHHLQRYAPGPPRLDWSTQPDPFRRYADAPSLALPLLEQAAAPRFDALYRSGTVPSRAPELKTVSALFQLAFGLSAWKQYGEARWALRCNPSSGNLHPTEAYLLSQGLGDLEDGIYHYLSLDHRLERRARLGATVASKLLLVGLSSIHWREAWKYGERAWRYCQLDLGHAIGALRYAAAVLGWRLHWLTEWGDADIASLLGLDREDDFGPAEREQPDALFALLPADHGPIPHIEALLKVATEARWQGRANRLSASHRWEWPVIETVAAATTRPRGAGANPQTTDAHPPLRNSACSLSAVSVIRQRRSAQAYDGRSLLARADFLRLLDATLPRPGQTPWDALPCTPRVHLVLFVHRVESFPPGLYLLLRRAEAEALLKERLARPWAWEAAAEDLPLFRLDDGDTQPLARTLACHQDIAADGAFSVSLLAEFAQPLAHAPWRYRELFWEAGLIGQILYLEAEAAGMRGTGIGCFFDDAVHRLLGIDDESLQSLYHFTVGAAVPDTRLQTLPPYAHLDDRARFSL